MISDGRWIFNDKSLKEKALLLGLTEASEDMIVEDGMNEPPRKRARLTPGPGSSTDEEDEVDVTAMISSVYLLLGNRHEPDLTGLSLVAR